MDDLTTADLDAAFPDFGVLTYEVVPPSITDPTARLVLTSLGLPQTLDTFTLILNPRDFASMAEVDQRSPGPGIDHLIRLGVYANQFIVLDGTNGKVLALDESANLVLLASDLYRFTWFLYRLQLELTETTTDRDLEDRLIAQFSAADPEAAENLWREIIRDHLADL